MNKIGKQSNYFKLPGHKGIHMIKRAGHKGNQTKRNMLGSLSLVTVSKIPMHANQIFSYRPAGFR
jgi:hypothetical protein